MRSFGGHEKSSEAIIRDWWVGWYIHQSTVFVVQSSRSSTVPTTRGGKGLGAVCCDYLVPGEGTVVS